jgi:predicted nucleic acid-binding protein
MPGKRKYYWDSCAFIAWLTNEKRPPGELEGLEEIVKQIESRTADLFTSEITKSEVLEGKMTPAQRDAFTKLFQRRNVVTVDVGGRVMAVVKEIREWNSKISLPDAIHLATAIVYGADEFHTTDGAGKRKRSGDLVPLNGNVAGHKLTICTPQASQYSLLAGIGAMRIERTTRQSQHETAEAAAPEDSVDLSKELNDEEKGEPKTDAPQTTAEDSPTIQGSDSGRTQGETSGQRGQAPTKKK